MTIQSLNAKPIVYPGTMAPYANGNPEFSSSSLTTIDAVGEKVAYLFLLTKAGTISKIHFRTKTVATGDDIDVRLETVATTGTGHATGTLWGTNTNATQTIQDTDDNTWFETTLTSGAVIAAGDVGKCVAVVLEAPTGFVGNIAFSYAIYAIAQEYSYRSDVVREQYLTSWGTTSGSYAECVRVEYSDGSFATLRDSMPGTSLSYAAYDSADTPDECGLKLRVPFACRVIGVTLGGQAASDCEVCLYNASDTLLDSVVTTDTYPDYGYKYLKYLYFDSAQTLTKDAWYRITLKAVDGSDLCFAYYMGTSADAQWGCWGMDADDYKWTERTNGGSWTDTDNRIPLGFGLLIDGLDDGAGGGGGLLTHPGMAGGMRG